MTRFDLRTCVLLVSLMCFLTLVLPFCVPPAESRWTSPGGGRADKGLPPPPAADPDDIAVNTARGIGEELPGGFGFGNEACVVISGELTSTEQSTPFTEAPEASLGLNGTRWSLLLVWILAR
ncbi:MAG: hypothetical protein NTX17_10085 [Candidatus Eisenbacteria bacterium]|nr:hypothetical protein [Candidatus Eisenbacteria bacterium]